MAHSGAEYLASIYGTEKDKFVSWCASWRLATLFPSLASLSSPSLDHSSLTCTSTRPAHRVNCSFYYKIGACRHGDRCSRLHNKPTFSQVPYQVCGFALSLVIPILTKPVLLHHVQTLVMQNLYQNPSNVPALPDGRPGMFSGYRMATNEKMLPNARLWCRVLAVGGTAPGAL